MIICCKYFVPAYLRWAGTFRIKTDKPEIFLTFDDGPSPEVTPFVLDALQQAQAKASFFCSGEKAEQHPDLLVEIKRQNHQVGNHGYKHFNGLKTNKKIYLADIDRANNIIQSPLFRPPYGKLKPTQYFELRNRYKIVFWTILTRDFDTSVSWQQDFKKIKPHLQKGAILVFHDTPKAEEKLRSLLPAVLDYGKKKGFEFSGIV
ncbi:MAG: polysaccharide deacetylase family protein [Bacteroidales bacterium]|nr:polysaccharide deacetylase family protein [Bacteroidales bacterium]